MLRLARDESGVVLALAVIMIVLIGVLGAGLLVFVQRDLEAVIKVNQGQRAFEVAEAGVQVARQQLLVQKTIGRYDVDSSTDPDYYGSACDVAGESEDSEWWLLPTDASR
jgi:Tfp pilus assembly protein PilX